MTRARPPATWELHPHTAPLSSDTREGKGGCQLSVTDAGRLAQGAKLFSQGRLNEGKVASFPEREGKVSGKGGGVKRGGLRQNWALSPSRVEQS